MIYIWESIAGLFVSSTPYTDGDISEDGLCIGIREPTQTVLGHDDMVQLRDLLSLKIKEQAWKQYEKVSMEPRTVVRG